MKKIFTNIKSTMDQKVVIIAVVIIAVAAVGFYIYRKREGYLGQPYNPCEKSGNCDPIKTMHWCATLKKDGQFPGWGYNSMQECINDPRQIPASCQPNNTALFCEQLVRLGQASEVGTCILDTTSNPGPLDPRDYKCAINSATSDDWFKCTETYTGRGTNPPRPSC